MASSARTSQPSRISSFQEQGIPGARLKLRFRLKMLLRAWPESTELCPDRSWPCDHGGTSQATVDLVCANGRVLSPAQGTACGMSIVPRAGSTTWGTSSRTGASRLPLLTTERGLAAGSPLCDGQGGRLDFVGEGRPMLPSITKNTKVAHSLCME